MFTVNSKVVLDERELLKLIKRLEKMEKVQVRYGWWSVARYPRRHRARGRPVAQIAFWNEFGTRNKSGKIHIPPRPYLTRTGLMLKHTIYSDIVGFFRDTIYGKTFSTKALTNVPLKIHNMFEAVVGTGTALSPKTIANKGHDEHWKETLRLTKEFQVKIIKVK